MRELTLSAWGTTEHPCENIQHRCQRIKAGMGGRFRYEDLIESQGLDGVCEAPLKGRRCKGADSPEGVLCIQDPSGHQDPTEAPQVGTRHPQLGTHPRALTAARQVHVGFIFSKQN